MTSGSLGLYVIHDCDDHCMCLILYQCCSLLLSLRSSGSIVVSPRDADSLVSSWLLRAKQAAKPKVRALHDGHVALMQGAAKTEASAKGEGRLNQVDLTPSVEFVFSVSESNTPNNAELAAVVASALARSAFSALKDDEDDLYYEKGQATNAFMNDLVR